jgi:lysophospholipase L1-like esterase
MVECPDGERNDGRQTVVFIGDSFIEWGRWRTTFPEVRVVNLGICGDITAGVLHRSPGALTHRSSRIFVMVGANDLGLGVSVEVLLKNYDGILRGLRLGAPGAEVYAHSLFPNRHGSWGVALETLLEVNEGVEALTKTHGCHFIDIHEQFADDRGKLREELTTDGLHLSGAGYALWEDLIRDLVIG